MTRQKFKDFVAAKANEANIPDVDWDEEKRVWLEKLDTLLSNVTGWLKPYGENVKLNTQLIQLSEDHLGSYDAPLLIISIGNDTVRLEPIGAMLIGAGGRVDMKGPRGLARLILVPIASNGPRGHFRQVKNAEEILARPPVKDWVWKLASPPPSVKYTDLTEDSFLDALMGVVNG